MRLDGHIRTLVGSIMLVLIQVPLVSAAGEDKAQHPAQRAPRFDASVPRERQIQLALSAAPEAVSSKATVYILGPKGYEKVHEGTNGASCLVERSFKGTVQMTVAPQCYDAEGSRTLLLVILRKEELRAQGKSDEEIKADIANGYKEGRFKAPGPGLLYMMSSENFVWDPDSGQQGVFPGHVMFYAPYMTAKDLGYDSVSPTMMPYLVQPGQPDAMMVVIPARSTPGDDSERDSHKH